MKASINSVHSGSQARGILRGQDGFTLIEILISTLVLVAAIVTIYIGVVYAEQQLLNNYRDRVASLLASGELEMQNFYFKRSNGFRMHSGKDVVIDVLPRNKVLNGRLSIDRKRDTEFSGGSLLEYQYLLVTVKWIDPKSGKERYVTMREDYY